MHYLFYESADEELQIFIGIFLIISIILVGIMFIFYWVKEKAKKKSKFCTCETPKEEGHCNDLFESWTMCKNCNKEII